MIAAVLIAATLAVLALAPGQPLWAAAPVAAAGAVWGLSRLPPRAFALGLIGLVLAVASPQDLPAAGLWRSPVDPVGTLVFQNLGTLLGLPLPVSVFELLVVGAAAALSWRRAGRAGEAARPALGLPLVLGGFAVAAVLLLALGMARGGLFQGAYWQVRQLALLPVLAFVFHQAFTGSRRELGAVGVVVVAAACFKALLGVWFFFVVARPAGLHPAYVTTHPDTVLFVTAILVVAAWLVQRPTWGGLALGGGVAAWLLWAVYLNDRRIAWLELGAGLALTSWLVTQGTVRARARRALWVAVPVVALYVAAGLGTGSSSRLFAPLQAISSVDATKDSSTLAREVENYNLARTIESSPLWGQGFGHPYRQVIRSEATYSFELYRYIPHNSVYGLLMAGGVLGFLWLWLPLPLTMLLAIRGARAASSARARTAAVGAAVVVLCFALQAWGDMGTQSYPPVVLLALSLALSARVAVATGAWPAVSAPEAPRPAVRLEVCR